MPDLPVNIDDTYPDDAERPDRKEHQQHHDALHERYNEENAETGGLDGQTDDNYTALGIGSGRRPPGGSGSTLIGTYAGTDEVGGANTGVGDGALATVVNGYQNVAVGRNTGPTSEDIHDTVCIGINSYTDNNNTTAVGPGASTTGANGVAVGYQAITGGANAVAIGANVFSDVGEVRVAHVKFGHVAAGLWSVEIDGTEYTIAVVPA